MRMETGGRRNRRILEGTTKWGQSGPDTTLYDYRRACRVPPAAAVSPQFRQVPAMTDPPWADVDRYLIDVLIPPDDALDHAIEASAAAGLPPIAVTPPGGKLLHILARLVDARRVLEI